MKKLFAFAAVLSAGCLLFSACNAGDRGWYGPSAGNMGLITPDAAEGNFEGDNYIYESIVEQGFSDAQKQPSSYFSLDRNTATYAQVRSQIESGYKVSESSVRIEEMINYFDYNFPAPEEKSVSVSTALSSCPWNEDNKLMLVGLKTTEYKLENANANYVFLIDVSGSMSGDSRLGLAKKGLNLLLNELGDSDLVSIVTYASGVKTVLDGGECTESGKKEISNTISKLVASGATSGGDGLERAYRIAQEHFITGGNNRVIIISDGDFNVGMSSPTELKEFIQDKAQSGIYLSVLGVGMGNMRDDILETLATCGNGNYAYLDSEKEARKVFVDELKGNLYTVAKDAKAGVTFTESVSKYRLIGYDAKRISEDDFNNEQADTGEIGSNLCVTALYEVELAENAEGKLADVEVKYKDVTGESEINESVTCTVDLTTPSSDDLSFISCVAEFGLILRNSAYKGTASLSAVLTRLEALSAYMANDIYKQEFVTLVGLASESKHYKDFLKPDYSKPDDNKPDYSKLEISKIETCWMEGFGPFPREFVRTFDLKTGEVTDTCVADNEYIPEDEINRYNTPKLIIKFSEENAQEFIEAVKSLGFYDWEERYSTNEVIHDGGSNLVTVYFSDGTKKSTSIYFEYPPKYTDIRTAFKNYLGAELYFDWDNFVSD